MTQDQAIRALIIISDKPIWQLQVGRKIWRFSKWNNKMRFHLFM